MTKKKTVGLIGSFKRGVVISFAILFILSIVAVYFLEGLHLRARIDEGRSFHVDESRDLLKTEVEHLKSRIVRLQARAQKDLEQTLKKRVDLAVKNIKRLHQDYAPKYGKNAIISFIESSFRGQNEVLGKNYYFAVTLDGKSIVTSAIPNSIKKNVIKYKSSDGRPIVKEFIQICRDRGQGFVKYSTNKPNIDGEQFKKLSYIKLYRPLGICIGTGEYLDDFAKEQQESILSGLMEDFHFNQLGGFVGNYEGVSIYGPSRGKNMYYVRDSDGKFVVQELINVARDGGGFISYRMPFNVQNSNALKLSYVTGIPEWKWYIGAGTFLEGIGQEKQKQEIYYVHHLTEMIVLIIVLFTLISLILFIFFRHFSKIVKNQIHHFSTALSEGDVSAIEDQSYYDELKRIIDNVTDMIRSKKDFESEHESYEVKLRKAINELKGKSVNAQSALDAKSSFLANMSHEIRTPLNSIIGMSDILSEMPLSKNQRDYVQILKHSSEHLHYLINDILDFSRVEAGALSFDFEEFNFHSLCEDVLSIISVRFPSLTFSLNYRCNVPYIVDSDQLRLRQVLLNLLSNAGKATSEGEVSLVVEIMNKDFFAIHVMDTGIGIHDNRLGEIFDMFNQLDGSFTKNFEGTGLGLTITKAIVEHLNGKIEVASKVGVGSTFSIILPRGILKEQVTVPLYKEILKGKTVGVYSSFSLEADSLAEIFSRFGASVMIYNEEYIDKLEKNEFNVICFSSIANDQGKISKVCNMKQDFIWTAANDTHLDDIYGDPFTVLNRLKRPLLPSNLFNYMEEYLAGEVKKNSSNLQVIILESDENYYRSLSKQVLNRLNYNFFYCSDPEAAAKIFRENNIDLFLFSDNFQSLDIMRLMEMSKNGSKTSSCLLSSTGKIRDAFSDQKIFGDLYILNRLSGAEDIYEFLSDFSDRPRTEKRNQKSDDMKTHKVLVVDDNSSNLMLIELMLKPLGLDIITVDSAKKAYDAIDHESNLSLILMDIQMPEIDGMTAIKKIRKDEIDTGAWPIPIFALTAYSMKEEHDKIMSSGCNGILTKPIKKNVLQDFIKDFFQL